MLMQPGVTPFTTLVTATLAAPLVKAAGLPAQLAFTWPAAFVTLTVTVHDDAPAGTCRLVVVMVPAPAVAAVAAAALAQVPPTAAGVATRSPDGSVSTNPTFETAGAPAGLVTVNVSVVVPPSAVVVGLKDLLSVGVVDRTARQLALTPLTTFVTATFAAPLVKAAGLPAQLAFTWPAPFVTLTVTVHDDAPAGTCRLVVVMVPAPAVAAVAAAALAQVPPTAAGVATRS